MPSAQRTVKMSLSDWPGDTRFLRFGKSFFVHLSTALKCAVQAYRS
jgi:hypothetical protein